MEGESSAGFRLLSMREWKFHLGVPFLVLSPVSLFYNIFTECPHLVADTPCYWNENRALPAGLGESGDNDGNRKNA
jgi:hypothetical protein